MPVNGSCHSALPVSPARCDGVILSAGLPLGDEEALLLCHHGPKSSSVYRACSEQATCSLPHPVQLWPSSRGPNNGEERRNILTPDCLNSDLMFLSLSASLDLFFCDSCQASSCRRLSWTAIPSELWRTQLLSSIPGAPQPGTL